MSENPQALMARYRAEWAERDRRTEEAKKRLRDLGFSTRNVHVLLNADITTREQLLDTTREEFDALTGWGKTGWHELDKIVPEWSVLHPPAPRQPTKDELIINLLHRIISLLEKSGG